MPCTRTAASTPATAMRSRRRSTEHGSSRYQAPVTPLGLSGYRSSSGAITWTCVSTWNGRGPVTGATGGSQFLAGVEEPTPRGQPAVDGQGLAVHERRIIGGEE